MPLHTLHYNRRRYVLSFGLDDPLDKKNPFKTTF